MPLYGNADTRLEKRQTDIPPLFHADRNRHFYHLRMSYEVTKLTTVVNRPSQARTHVPSQTRFHRWSNQC